MLSCVGEPQIGNNLCRNVIKGESHCRLTSKLSLNFTEPHSSLPPSSFLSPSLPPPGNLFLHYSLHRYHNQIRQLPREHQHPYSTLLLAPCVYKCACMCVCVSVCELLLALGNPYSFWASFLVFWSFQTDRWLVCVSVLYVCRKGF